MSTVGLTRFWTVRAKFVEGLLCSALACFFGGMTGQTQGTQATYSADPANLPDAISKVQSGNFYGIQVEMIARANAVQAIPALEKQFTLTTDQNMKATIASALVRLGDSDDQYWHFLVNLALPVIESDEPDFFIYDSKGRASAGPSPALVGWAKSHNVPIDQAYYNAVYGANMGLGHLAMTGDPRGIPLLRRALQSPNFAVETLAAKGLATANDKGSIPTIVAACKQAPADAAGSIAEALIYFDDSTAQSEANQYIPAATVALLRAARAQGKAPF